MPRVSARIKEAYDHYSDQLWRMHNLYKIVNAAGELVPFRPNWAQTKLLEDAWLLNIVLKARQMGFSTLIDIWALDETLWNKDFHAGIIAHTRDDVKVLFRDKIRTPYDNLPDRLKARFAAKQDSQTELVFRHGSSIRVGVSMRSGTLQFLHISEHGKICARFPDKAREVRTGSLNTVHPGQVVFIESTAEGRDGDFYEFCTRASQLKQEGRKLTQLDYRFHFFAWWQHPSYSLPPEEVLATPVSPELRKYFDDLHERWGIHLTPGQMAWYAKKSEEQRGDMKREFPSHPDEAFEMAVEGAYYGKQMEWLRTNHRLSTVPHDPTLPVHTAWDLGRNDSNAIWFIQEAPGRVYRVIDYYENHGEPIQHYGREMQQRANKTPGWFYGVCYLPHDAEITDFTREDNKTREQILQDMGFKTLVVPRVQTNAETGEGVQAVRDTLPLCYFDRERCSDGIKALDHYQREWDDKLGAFRDRPLHNWASHGAKAFEQFARGHRPVSNVVGSRRARRAARRKGGWKVA